MLNIPDLANPSFNPSDVLEYLKNRFVDVWYSEQVFFYFISYHMDEMGLSHDTKIFLLEYWRNTGEIMRLRLRQLGHDKPKFKFRYPNNQDNYAN